MFTRVRAVQSLNAAMPIMPLLLRVTVVNAVQPSNALSPTEVTLEGNVTSVR